jgi:hypothetical protein
MKKLIDFIIKYPVPITVIMCLIFYFLPFKPKPFGDGEYHEGTIELIEYILNGFNGQIRVDKGILTLFYYIIPYSLAYVFHNDSVYYHFGIIFNALVLCLSIQYLFKTFTLLNFSNKSKFWTIVILNLFPIHIYYSMGILAETAAFFSISLFVYALIKTNSGYANKKYVILLAFSLLLLGGTRPNLLPFAILFLIYFLFQKINWKLKATLFVLLVGCLLGLVELEKNVTTGDESFKSIVFANQIVWSRFELRDEPFNWLPQHGLDEFASKDYINNLKKRKEMDSICEANHYKRTTYFLNWVKDDIVSHPILTLRQYTMKFFQSQSFIISPLIKSNKSLLIKYGVHIYINLINYALVIIGLFSMYKLYRKKNYKLFIPFLLFWGWSLIYVFLFHSEQRYMLPLRPILIFLFCYYFSGFNNLKQKID